MKRLRAALLAGVCVATLVAPRPAYALFGAGDIVFDPTNLGELILQYAQLIKEYVLQGEQYATQVQQYATEVEMFINWVHNPTLGGALGLMQAAGLGTYLPVQPIAMLGLINGIQSAASGNLSLGGISALFGNLSGFASQAFSTNHVYSPMQSGWEGQRMNAAAAANAGLQGGAVNSYDGLQQHMLAMEALREHALGLESPKDVADTQLQVGLEQLWTENNNGQLLATTSAYTAQVHVQEQMELEGTTQSMDNFIAACGCGL